MSAAAIHLRMAAGYGQAAVRMHANGLEGEAERLAAIAAHCAFSARPDLRFPSQHHWTQADRDHLLSQEAYLD